MMNRITVSMAVCLALGGASRAQDNSGTAAFERLKR